MLLADANDLGRILVRIGLFARGPVYDFVSLGDRHNGRLFLVLDERYAFEFAFFAAHDLGKHGRLAFAVADFVLLD